MRALATVMLQLHGDMMQLLLFSGQEATGPGGRWGPTERGLCGLCPRALEPQSAVPKPVLAAHLVAYQVGTRGPGEGLHMGP